MNIPKAKVNCNTPLPRAAAVPTPNNPIPALDIRQYELDIRH